MENNALIQLDEVHGVPFWMQRYIELHVLGECDNFANKFLNWGFVGDCTPRSSTSSRVKSDFLLSKDFLIDQAKTLGNLSGLGASIVDMGGTLYLFVNGGEQWMKTFRDSKLVMTPAGEISFVLDGSGLGYGAQNKAFKKFNNMKYLKNATWFKTAGGIVKIGDIAGLGVSVYELNKKRDAKSAFSFSMELFLYIAGGSAATVLKAGAAASGALITTAGAPIIVGGIAVIGLSELAYEKVTGEEISGVENLYDFLSWAAKGMKKAIKKSN